MKWSGFGYEQRASNVSALTLYSDPYPFPHPHHAVRARSRSRAGSRRDGTLPLDPLWPYEAEAMEMHEDSPKGGNIPNKGETLWPTRPFAGAVFAANHNVMRHPVTPDGRYFVVRGRLWRCTDPNLSMDRREELTRALMDARREKGRAMLACDTAGREAARKRVEEAKQALGERGPVWWTDGAPDLNRHMVWNTPYADWFAALPEIGTPIQAAGQRFRS